MLRMLTTTLLASSAVLAVSALAYAEETIIEKHTYESQKNTVETVPAPEVKQRVIEERTVTEPAAVQKRTETVVTEQPVVKKRTDTVTTKTHEED